MTQKQNIIDRCNRLEQQYKYIREQLEKSVENQIEAKGNARVITHLFLSVMKGGEE